MPHHPKEEWEKEVNRNKEFDRTILDEWHKAWGAGMEERFQAWVHENALTLTAIQLGSFDDFVRSELTSSYSQGKEDMKREVREKIELLKKNVPPYPMQGPNAEMITWAAKQGYGDSLEDLLKAL